MIESFFVGLFENIQWSISNLPINGYEVIFLVAFLEGLAFIGALFPGTIIMILAGGLCYADVYELHWAFMAGALGALAADVVSYYLGRKKRKDLKFGKRKIYRLLYAPEAGNFLLEKGGLSIVIGRFLGATRSFVPFYMGVAGETERKFIAYDMVGAFVWSACYLLLGYVFANSFAVVQNVVIMVFVFSGLMIVISFGSLFITKFLKKKIK